MCVRERERERKRLGNNGNTSRSKKVYETETTFAAILWLGCNVKRLEKLSLLLWGHIPNGNEKDTHTHTTFAKEPDIMPLKN